MQGGGGRRGDERVARSVLPHVCLRRCHPGFRVEAGGGRVHTHLCRCTRSRRAPVSPPTRHRRLLPTRAASAPPTRASSPCPCPTPLLLCLSALPLAVTTHAAVAAKVAVEQRLQRLPPRSPLPSALGLAAVKPRPPHALSSPRIRCAVRNPSLGLTSLLALRTHYSPELTLPCTTGTRAAPRPCGFNLSVAHTRREGGRSAPEVTAPTRRRAAAVWPADRACRTHCLVLERLS